MNFATLNYLFFLILCVGGCKITLQNKPEETLENTNTPLLPDDVGNAFNALTKRDLTTLEAFCLKYPDKCKTGKNATGKSLLQEAISLDNLAAVKYLIKEFSELTLQKDVDEKNVILSNLYSSPKGIALELLENASMEQLKEVDNNGKNALDDLLLRSGTRTDLVEKLCEKDPLTCQEKATFEKIAASDINDSQGALYALVGHYLKTFNKLPDYTVNDNEDTILTIILKEQKNHGRLTTNFVDMVVEKADFKLLRKRQKDNKSALNQLQSTPDAFSAVLQKYPKLKKEQLNPTSPKNPTIETLIKREGGIFKTVKEKLSKAASTTVDNDFISIKNDGAFEIKKPATKPVLVTNEGEVKELSTLETIGFNDVLDSRYVLLPQNFYEKNPFASTKITFPRPNIWGFFLKKEKEEKNTVVYEVDEVINQISPVQIPQNDFDKIYAPALRDDAKLGGGGGGTVYALDGKHALKASKESLASEFNNLEKLQFTNAVAKIYGYFKHDQNEYMVMERGQKDLLKAIEDGDTLGDDLLLKTANEFLLLNDALKNLGIKFNDIKPANFIVTNDGIKAIDINEAFTYGYSGKTGELLARILMSAYLKATIKVPSALKGFYLDWDDEKKAESNEYITSWFRSFCSEKNLLTDCSSINDFFDELYPLLTKEDRIGFVLKYEQSFDGPRVKAEIESATKLNNPYLMEDETITEWARYLEKQKVMLREFCLAVKGTELKEFSYYDKEFRSTYQSRCDLISAPAAHTEFTKSDDEFKKFALGYFQAKAKESVWGGFALSHDSRFVFNYIFDTQIKPKNPELYNKIIRLYQR